jgi:DNA-binding NarL/FixJ family response regulator
MKILVVDDHALFRDGLKYVLGALADNICILEACNGHDSIEILANNPDMDLVLVDLNLPGESGFTLLDNCRTNHPTIPLVVVSASKHQADIQRAKGLGVTGYISKDTTSKVMIGILQVILSGGIYFPETTEDNQPQFTPRQTQVITLMVDGVSNKVIASNLDIAEATIKMHVTAIFKKLGVSNRTQAAAAINELGLTLN